MAIQTTDDIPRRDRIERQVPAERLMRSARSAIAAMPGVADEQLVEALRLLDLSTDLVSSYVDQNPVQSDPSVGLANAAGDEILRQEADPDFLKNKRIAGG